MTVHIRKLSKPEMEQWVKAIHVVCDVGWVPALRSAFSHLMPFVDEDCSTAYTDCQYRIGIGPNLLDPSQTTLEQLATVILHETLHNTQHHRQRLFEKKGINGKLCNFAADLEINSLIAQGVHEISLKRDPDIGNGHWERLIGTFEMLDEDGAREINAKVDENGKPLFAKSYRAGDMFYQGILLPRQGQFHDFPDNLTAEQYLGLLEVDVEDMTLTEFMNKMQDNNDQPEQQNGNGSSNSDGNEDDSENGSTNGADNSTNETDDGHDSSSENGNGTNGGDGSDGASAAANGSTGNMPSANGNGSGMAGAGAPGGNGAANMGAGSGGSAATSGSATASGNAAGGLGGVSGQGSMQDANGLDHNGSKTYDDGFGGSAQDLGDGHVSVTHIYKRNADGTRTEVGRDNLVDDFGKHADDEVWKEASRLGIDPISRTEEQKVRDQIAHDIEMQRKTNGYGSGSALELLRYIERGLRPPLVDWKKMLRHVVTRACQEQTKGRSDYTYRRINRRYSQGDFIFPGMTTYIPTVRFALDTSGSMSATEYYNAFSEAEGILKFVKAKIDFVCWDGEATDAKKVKTLKEMKANLKGGGGTDPAVVSEQIEQEKERNRPDVLVVATDGCFDWDHFAESLSGPAMQNLIPVVLIVYKFSEDAYQNKQKELPALQKKLRRYHKKAMVLQAWSK